MEQSKNGNSTKSDKLIDQKVDYMVLFFEDNGDMQTIKFSDIFDELSEPSIAFNIQCSHLILKHVVTNTGIPISLN